MAQNKPLMVAAFYRFARAEQELRTGCSSLVLRGLGTVLAAEGVNGTVCGKAEAVSAFSIACV